MAEITQVITPAPPAPSRNDPENFAPVADEFISWQEKNPPEVNMWSAQANTLSGELNSVRADTIDIKDETEVIKNTAISETENIRYETQTIHDTTASIANSKGAWIGLTGSFDAGISVYHVDTNWQLLQDIIDIASVEPGTDASVWSEIKVRNQIETPVIIYPTTGTDNIGSSLTVEGTVFRSLYGYNQTDAQIQVSKLLDFSTTVIDTVSDSPVSTFDITGLNILTTYYCRIRYQDSVERWSSWAVPVLFTTANVYIRTPINVNPANLEANIGETPTLTSDAFETINGTDTHLSSDWQVFSDSGLSILIWSSYGDTTNLITAEIPAGILNPGSTNYYWRCKHTGTTYGASAWSLATKFTTKDQFYLVYGIAMVSPGGGAGTWQQVNENGNNVTLSKTDFDNHPIWGNIETVIIDGQSMVKIPKFYLKVGILPGGDQVGKKAWLVSNAPLDEYYLSPAFMDQGTEIDQFYYGSYEATPDGTKAGSKVGVLPLVSIDFTTMQARCNARNVGEVDGFHMVNIHELSAVQVLCLIENGGPDVQSSIGQGNVSSSAAVNTGASNANWRGIYELWGNTRCMIDGAQFDATNKIKVFDQNGNNSYVSTGVTLGAASGWITGVHWDAGPGYDLGMMFLGKTTDGTENNGSFGDYQYAPNTNVNVCYHGGYWDRSSQGGLFYLDLRSVVSDQGMSSGSRLAKV